MLKPLSFLPFLFLVTLAAQQPAGAPAGTAAAASAPAAAAPAAATAAAASIPADAAAMVNPVKPTADVLARAKKMYGYECAMCHGDNGNGKGDVVADMKLTLKDYTDAAALKDLSDGEMFYIIKNGRGQMSGEGNRAKTDDVWALVLLVRSFGKK